ncbi:response regulator transcription factor [Thermophilibacter provencensis]|uniref:Response regulator transcription factor n=1 Tax=Thermophilibacter provencensis TaxID=1852386 RepID=A0A921KLI6_9ACTN|nr:response regulator transcription factor [Thermophilibacter provencensis]MBM6815109.1 response regulator transcription factor [Olsenella uli]HJF45383.1 response regulator transcription factor [Thermophilibacter provencensis]
MQRILLAEDDQLIVEGLSELLANEGFVVDSSPTQAGAVELACRPGAGYALALVDLTLAEGNGFAVCNAIKTAAPDVPVIFLTAADDELNTVTGLSMGADDYVAKPFRPRELVARIHAAIRRAHPERTVLRLGRVAIDPDRAHVELDGQEVALSALEYRLLLLFAKNAGRLVTRDMMREALWDDAGAYVEENTLSVYIKRLRDKLEDDPSDPQLIVTVRGLGYRAGGEGAA